MATVAQLQQALTKAQAAGNSADVEALQNALSQATGGASNLGPVAQAQSGPTREQLSQAFYAAKQAGNEDDARQIIGYIQQHGMTLAPMSADQLNAAFQKQNAQNVAGMNDVTLGVPGVPALQFSFHAPAAVAHTVAGIGEGASNYYSGLKQHIYDPIADSIDGGNRGQQAQQQVAENRRLSQALNATTGGKVGNVIGGAMSAAPLALVPGGAEAGIGTRLGLAALTGGVLGYVQPSASTGENVANTVGGAVLGALVPGAAAGAGKLIGGIATPEAKRLIAQGVKPSFGQMVGGAVGRIEQAMTSLPLTGDIIQAARNQGVDTFNRAATNKVLSPIGEQLPNGASLARRLFTSDRSSLPQGVATGQPSMAYAANAASRAYDAALNGTNTVADQQLMGSLASRLNALPARVREKVIDVLESRVFPSINESGGTLDGRAYKDMTSGVLGDMTALGRSNDPIDRNASAALGGILGDLKGAFARSNGDAAAAKLAAADRAYRGIMALKDATNAAGRTREGVFTPGEFLGAVKRNDSSKGKSAFSRGNAFLQDFGNDAQSAIGNTIGNSFTFDRLAHGTVPGWLASPVGAPLAIPNLPGVRGAMQMLLAPTTAPATRAQLARLLGFQSQQYIPVATNALLLGRQAPTPPIPAALPAPAAFGGN